MATVMNIKAKIALQAIVASAVLLTFPVANAKGFTKASCIEAVYQAAAAQGLVPGDGTAALTDRYCSCYVANQSKLSQKTVDSYCTGMAKSSTPKDPVAERARMLLIEQMMAPRQPSPMKRALDQYLYEEIYKSMPR